MTEEKIDQLQRNIKLTSAILGYFASDGKAENVYATNVAAQLDYDNNWFWLVVQAGFFGLTVYEVFNAVEGLIDTFDRMSADGELSLQEADELVQTAKTFGLTITFEVTAGKVVKGLKIAAIAGDFAVTAAKAIGLDKALAKLNDRFQKIGGAGKNGPDATRFDHANIPDDWRKISSLGAQINTPSGFTSYRTSKGEIVHVSPSGLVYGADPKFGNRVDHVLDHTAPNPNKTNHSVFNAKGDDALALVDEAWAKRGAAEPNDPKAFVIDMGRVVGTNGETKIRVVADPFTNEITTAYPYERR